MRRPSMLAVAVAVATACAVLSAPARAAAGDAALVRAHAGAFRAAEAAAPRIGPPDGTQVAYGAARDLQEALRSAAPVSGACRPLLGALTRYADGRVAQAEGVDRLDAGVVRAGRARAEAARAAVARARRACAGRGTGAGAARGAMSPVDGQAFFGAVVVRAPSGATHAALFRGTREVARVPVTGGRARFSVDWAPGRHDVRVAFSAGSRALGTVAADGVWLLPASARVARAGERADPALAASLEDALAGAGRYRAAWVQGLASGRVAGVNADAVFPAASTVKLGLLAGVLARSGARPEASRYAYDMRAVAAWSSNLAANRLLTRFGPAAATDGLRRLDARVSTYTGAYIVGTELQPGLPGGGGAEAVPRSSQRVTSARDLARMLFAVHASAVDPAGRRETGLTEHQARLMLGWLLASEQRGENTSLFRSAARGAPVAEKNGWLRSARLGASLIYGPSGPAIAVVVAHDEAGVPARRARAVGAGVARVALRAN